LVARLEVGMAERAQKVSAQLNPALLAHGESPDCGRVEGEIARAPKYIPAGIPQAAHCWLNEAGSVEPVIDKSLVRGEVAIAHAVGNLRVHGSCLRKDGCHDVERHTGLSARNAGDLPSADDLTFPPVCAAKEVVISADR